jgi:hypothetical protein
MQRNYTVVLAVACVVIYSWLCTRMIPLLVLRAEPVLVVPRRAIAVMKTRREARSVED